MGAGDGAPGVPVESPSVGNVGVPVEDPNVGAFKGVGCGVDAGNVPVEGMLTEGIPPPLSPPPPSLPEGEGAGS